MNSVVTAVRLHLVAWRVRLGLPWLILILVFAVNLALFAAIVDRNQVQAITGGVLCIFIIEQVHSGQTISQLFPYAIGLGVTRRAFYIANVAILLARATLFGAGLCLLSLVEDATSGWGISMRFFAPLGLNRLNPFLLLGLYSASLLLMAVFGLVAGVIFKRWGMNGIMTSTVASVVVGGSVLVLISWQQWWRPIGAWFGDQPAAALLAGWPGVLAAVLALGGWLVIRRTNPA